MNHSTSRTFRKTFEDRYSLSRESQILDYLNQRSAPVPAVVMSHVAEGYLEMSHAGQDLRTWFEASGTGSATVCEVLVQAVQALISVAQMGIWHLDVASRNFMIDTAGAGLKVRLIDFANAISDDFPLQKPLWMMPSPALHPQLSQALAQDWEAFFKRHGLSAPARWDQIFDIPLAVYRQDWVRALQVEQAGGRWTWLAHGVGHLLDDIRQRITDSSAIRLPSSSALLGLRSEEQAQAALDQVLQDLARCAQGTRQRDEPTPRPRPRLIGVAPAPAPAPVAPAPASPAPQTSGKRYGSGLAIAAGTLSSVCGWFALDTLFVVLRIPISWVTLMVVALVSLATLAGMLRIVLRRQNLAARWLRLLLLQALGQATLLIDLWLARTGTAAYALALMAPLLTLAAVLYART